MTGPNIFGLREYSRKDLFEDTTDEIREADRFYIMHEADNVLAELEELHKMEIVKLKSKLDIYKRGFAEDDKTIAYLYAELRHNKYKRCLKNREICVMRFDIELARQYPNRAAFWAKWERKWLKLAEKSKENNDGRNFSTSSV